MRLIHFIAIVVTVCLSRPGGPEHRASAQSPPYSGSAFIDEDIITSDDPTTFLSTEYIGRGSRLVFDRRVNRWLNLEMQLFSAAFSDGLSAEIRVNPEFGGIADAEIEATKYADAIGRLPTSLRVDVASVTIHRGIEPFGGGNKNFLIHTGQAERYGGFLEEILVHEATHTSMDAHHASVTAWVAAQEADGNFISTYARDFSVREDVAESFLPWLAVRHRSSRIDAIDQEKIVQAIGNRLEYFDRLSLDLTPITVPVTITGDFNNDSLLTAADVDLLSAAIREISNNTVFDLNGDGSIDDADHKVWVGDVFGTFFGDVDLNKEVAFADFLSLSSNFGLEGGWAKGDFDGSGTVLFPDFLLLSANFGKSALAAFAVPEPNAAMLLLAGLVGLVRRRSIVSKKVWRRRDVL